MQTRGYRRKMKGYNLYDSTVTVHTFGENSSKKFLILSNDPNNATKVEDSFFLDGIYNQLTDVVKSQLGILDNIFVDDKKEEIHVHKKIRVKK